MGRTLAEIKSEIPKLVSEKVFDTVDEHSFYFEPSDDCTFQIIASEPLKKGEQMPYHYGWCNNRFFLINYGFCIPNNIMDAFVIRLELASGEQKIVLLHRGGSQKLFLKLLA